LLSGLERPATAAALARRHGLDATLLRGVLEYVAARTDLLRRSGDRFVATKSYSADARFLLDMYAGAYSSNAVQLARLLRKPARAAKAIDRRRHARAFDAVEAAALGALPAIIQQLGLGAVLDLGCGTAALLIELATRDPHFVGWGLELNPAMCKVARRRIRSAHLGSRVHVLEGDCAELRAALPADVAAAVRTVTMSDVANEMFADGNVSFVAWLRRTRKLLQGHLLLISDYYGCLGREGARLHRETLLQDYAQVISGQGVPPASAREWRRIYGQAGCRLVHVIEDRATTRFIHFVKL